MGWLSFPTYVVTPQSRIVAADSSSFFLCKADQREPLINKTKGKKENEDEKDERNKAERGENEKGNPTCGQTVDGTAACL